MDIDPPLDDTARKEAPGQFVGLSRGRVHFDAFGPPGGPPVLLASGLTLPGNHWTQTARALGAAGMRAIVFDFYGRGFSDRPDVPYDLDLFLGQMLELLDSQAQGRPAHVVGSSFGGILAANFALRHPDRVSHLVLVDTAGMPMPLPEWVHQVLAPDGEAFFRENAPALMRAAVNVYVRRPELAAELLPPMLSQMAHAGFYRAVASTLRHIPLDGSLEAFRELGARNRPILIVWGAEDRVCPVACVPPLAQLLRPYRQLIVGDAAHLPHLDKPGVVHPELVAFLRP